MTQTNLEMNNGRAHMRENTALQTMQAVHYDSYGPIDRLTLRELARPIARAGEVLVRVQAAALHVGDIFFVRGEPFAVRLSTGLAKPKYGVPGFDVCGAVEAVGAGVTRFQVGDRVLGTCLGSCAQFVSTRADTLVHAPERLSAAQAAALPTSGLAALHALRDVAKLKAGQKLLINGASGGIGTIAVQLAKARGAEVTAVCSGGRSELMSQLGADHVLDYTREDFSEGTARYDVILDNVENHSLERCRRALTPNGLLILNSGVGAEGLAFWVRLLKPVFLSPFSNQSYRRYLSMPNQKDLEELTVLAAGGTLTPVIGQTFPLHETAQALAHIATGHALGKTVIEVQA
jgi:NADPH:quinone reductase-like Zn-dependent oxidoreductase